MTHDPGMCEHFAIVDVEATCCSRKTIPRSEKEIIEIGAVMLEAEGLQAVDEFQTFVSPVRHPILTEFCTRLTGIAQKDVRDAPSFPEAIARFREWLGRYRDPVVCSWGAYDRKQMARDGEFHGVESIADLDHVNVKKLFSVAQRLERTLGMARALELAGLELDGTHHRGIDDARNIAKLMPYVLGRERLRA